MFQKLFSSRLEAPRKVLNVVTKREVGERDDSMHTLLGLQRYGPVAHDEPGLWSKSRPSDGPRSPRGLFRWVDTTKQPERVAIKTLYHSHADAS